MRIFEKSSKLAAPLKLLFDRTYHVLDENRWLWSLYNFKALEDNVFVTTAQDINEYETELVVCNHKNNSEN